MSAHAWHFAPRHGQLGDPIPFVHDGRYHLFFLRQAPGVHLLRDLVWAHALSEDLLHWQELPDALTPSPGSWDAQGCWTGCVLAHGGRFHAFYTGVSGPDPDVPWTYTQRIGHAVSDDLVHWRKDPEPILAAPGPGLQPRHCRDPHVFWQADAGEWWMLLTGRRELPERRRGCGALLLARSPDLEHWQLDEAALWAADCCNAPECPDRIPGPNHDLLIYYNQAATCAATTSDWIGFTPIPEHVIDGPALHAGKCFHDGDTHLALGWMPPPTDPGPQNWDGRVCSLPRQLDVAEDGGLRVRLPDRLREAFDHHATAIACSAWQREPSGYGHSRAERIVGDGILHLRIEWEHRPWCWGLVLRGDGRPTQDLLIEFQPANHSLRVIAGPWSVGGRCLAERRCAPWASAEDLFIVLDHDVLEIFLAEHWSLSLRVPPGAACRPELFALDGEPAQLECDYWAP